jgi:uncharacterized YccA/Bax inhibitor family protein
MLKDALRTSNPALSSKSFGGFVGTGAGGPATGTRSESRVMTIAGTVNKTAILLAVVMVGALLPWRLFFNSGNPASVYPFLFLGLIGGLITALIVIFKKEWAPFLAPVYAGCEGLLLGSVSAMYEVRFPGIVFQAVALTFGTLAVLLAVYKSGAIKATENFKLGVVAATGAVCLVYIGTWIMRMFGVEVGFMHDAGPIGIGISMVIVIIAALNLVLDFDFIEQGAAKGAPKYMEWYGAFGLLVTLVWLYLEILRLLSKLNSKR